MLRYFLDALPHAGGRPARTSQAGNDKYGILKTDFLKLLNDGGEMRRPPRLEGGDGEAVGDHHQAVRRWRPAGAVEVGSVNVHPLQGWRRCC